MTSGGWCGSKERLRLSWLLTCRRKEGYAQNDYRFVIEWMKLFTSDDLVDNRQPRQPLSFWLYMNALTVLHHNYFSKSVPTCIHADQVPPVLAWWPGVSIWWHSSPHPRDPHPSRLHCKDLLHTERRLQRGAYTYTVSLHCVARSWCSWSPHSSPPLCAKSDLFQPNQCWSHRGPLQCWCGENWDIYHSLLSAQNDSNGA